MQDADRVAGASDLSMHTVARADGSQVSGGALARSQSRSRRRQLLGVAHGPWLRRVVLISLLLFVVGMAAGQGGPAITTAQAPPAPILLIVNDASSNKFGPYLGEILRVEGITSFDMVQLSTLTQQAQLTPYSTVILTETPLTAAQVTMISGYVNAGGSLIAMKPDTQLASTLGISKVNSPATTTDGYFKAETTHVTGAGL